MDHRARTNAGEPPHETTGRSSWPAQDDAGPSGRTVHHGSDTTDVGHPLAYRAPDAEARAVGPTRTAPVVHDLHDHPTLGRSDQAGLARSAPEWCAALATASRAAWVTAETTWSGSTPADGPIPRTTTWKSGWTPARRAVWSRSSRCRSTTASGVRCPAHARRRRRPHRDRRWVSRSSCLDRVPSGAEHGVVQLTLLLAPVRPARGSGPVAAHRLCELRVRDVLRRRAPARQHAHDGGREQDRPSG